MHFQKKEYFPAVSDATRIATAQEYFEKHLDPVGQGDTIIIAICIVMFVITGILMAYCWLHAHYRPIRAKNLPLNTIMLFVAQVTSLWRVRRIPSGFSEIREFYVIFSCGFCYVMQSIVLGGIIRTYNLGFSTRTVVTLFNAYMSMGVIWISLYQPVFNHIFHREEYLRKWTRNLANNDLFLFYGISDASEDSYHEPNDFQQAIENLRVQNRTMVAFTDDLWSHPAVLLDDLEQESMRRIL
ncbi:hypothetical protein DL89DRAFT_326039 [Linderina pennispora]|uniref:G-protein coupled receptors family 3 profile domain-containing protein n=1 Tax=Linderina pennispora TaxID=61395 RepID=A0A1Y1VUY0_9FUNG|nr:uncharacterized protein DL89DRAFT_326039 [Linderina pennispora]ORX65087.1 hypothetical protein DL89DRAFT_326039 [Linderina pennispora]